MFNNEQQFPSIKKLWSVKNTSAELTRLTQPMVFDGCFEVIVARYGRFSMVFEDQTLSFESGLYLAGQITKPMALQLSANTELFFIKLHHGYAASLTRENLAQLTNQAVELLLLDPHVHAILLPLLNDTLSEQSYLLALAAMNHHLQRQRQTEQRFSQFACSQFMQVFQYSSAKTDVITQFDLSQRGFETRFKRLVGINPKQYASLARLRLVTETLMLEKCPDNLTHLALDMGFYDQAHFCRAMRDFVGASPQNINFERWFIPAANDSVRFFTI